MLVPLGSESSEYPDILAGTGTDAMAVGRAAWAAATGAGDMLVLRHVRHGSLLDRVAKSSRLPTTRHTDPAPWICFDRFPDFGTYLAGSSAARQATLRRRRRTLAKCGALEFGVLAGPLVDAGIVDWLLARKRDWLRQKGLRSVWLDTPEYAAFLNRITAEGDPAGAVRIFTLRVDGKLIAVLLGTVDRTWLEYYLSGYDPAWARFSPGAIILAECIGWAHANGRQFDFRLGNEDYKSIWANSQSSVTTFHVALTAIGLVPVAREALRLALGSVRRLLKPWRRRGRVFAAWLRVSWPHQRAYSRH